MVSAQPAGAARHTHAKLHRGHICIMCPTHTQTLLPTSCSTSGVNSSTGPTAHLIGIG
jgi:hypothetical protein